MTTRSYQQYCGTAKALDVLGDRWTLLIIRDLLLGPMRYNDLHQSLAGIGTDVLANRLKRLQAAGAINKRTLQPPAASTVYELTEHGQLLQPAIAALGQFGGALLDHPLETTDRFDVGWALLSATKDYRGCPPTSEGTYQLNAADRSWHITLTTDHATAYRGPATNPRLTIDADEPFHLGGLLAGALEPDDAIAAETIRLTGPRRDLTRLITSLPLRPNTR